MTREEFEYELNKLRYELFAPMLEKRARAEERVDVLTALIVDRFGQREDVHETANRLARWTDRAAAIHAIQNANSLDELVTAEPPA